MNILSNLQQLATCCRALPITTTTILTDFCRSRRLDCVRRDVEVDLWRRHLIRAPNAAPCSAFWLALNNQGTLASLRLKGLEAL